jgi:hypothetical protein
VDIHRYQWFCQAYGLSNLDELDSGVEAFAFAFGWRTRTEEDPRQTTRAWSASAD